MLWMPLISIKRVMWFCPHGMPVYWSILPDAWCAQYDVTLHMQSADVGQQLCVVLCPSARRTATPAVISAGRDLQTLSHQPNRERVAAALDNAVLHFDSLVKKAATSRKSRSFITRARLRLSAAALSSRGCTLTWKRLGTLGPRLPHPPGQHIRADTHVTGHLAGRLVAVPHPSNHPRLNSAENILLIAMTHLRAQYEP